MDSDQYPNFKSRLPRLKEGQATLWKYLPMPKKGHQNKS